MADLPEVLRSIPHEILDSKLFKFEVTLPSVFEHYCEPCHVVFDPGFSQCPQCGSTSLQKRNKTIAVDLLAHVSLDYENVERQLLDISAEMTFWATVYSEAKYRVSLLDRAVKTVRATAYDDVIKAGMKEGVKLAADVIKQLVEKDERVNRAEGDLAKAHMVTSKLYYMYEAIKTKGELARSLTSLKRSEMNGS